MPRTALTPSTRPETKVRARHSNKPEVLELGLELNKLQERKRAAKKLLEQLDLDETVLCEKLARAGVVFGETIACGKVRLERSWREPREALSLTDAKKQGAITPLIRKVLAPFISKGDPYEIWTAKLLPKAIPPETPVEQAAAS